MPYKILKATTTEDLETLVNAEYPAYRPHGGVVYDGTNYCQVLVQYY